MLAFEVTKQLASERCGSYSSQKAPYRLVDVFRVDGMLCYCHKIKSLFKKLGGARSQ